MLKLKWYYQQPILFEFVYARYKLSVSDYNFNKLNYYLQHIMSIKYYWYSLLDLHTSIIINFAFDVKLIPVILTFLALLFVCLCSFIAYFSLFIAYICCVYPPLKWLKLCLEGR